LAIMDRESQEIVRILCVFLRIAESLDRSRAGAVRHVQFHQNRKKGIELEIIAKNDCPLEMWAVKAHAKTFKRVFGREFTVSLSDQRSVSKKGSRS
jgi:exopolyphosphatase / guanosine-5'-triphosphate,3'-diphosphate pyrophosphatase